MMPGHEDREDLTLAKGSHDDEAAAMMPGHEDREDGQMIGFLSG